MNELIFILVTLLIVSIVIGIMLVMFFDNNDWYRMLGACMVFGSAFSLGIIVERYNVSDNIEEVNIEIQKDEILKQISFEDSIKMYIEELNIDHADIVFNQARIESGNFSSTIYKENNNMFGMKVATQRPTTSIGENRGYAVYLNWQQSIIDYALLQSWSYKNLNRKEYLDKLNNNYAEDSLYIDKIK
jgi:uncharacterized FlgJ-related protein